MPITSDSALERNGEKARRSSATCKADGFIKFP